MEFRFCKKGDFEAMSQKLLLTKGYQSYLKLLRKLPGNVVIERLDEKMKIKGSL